MLDIKRMRLDRSMSQKELAKKIGVHQTAVSQWENGTADPSLSMIPALLAVFNCKIEELYVPDEQGAQE